MPTRSGHRSAVTVAIEGLERDPTLGRVAEELTPPVDALLGMGPLGDTLRGRSVGHALHPLLVQVPLGALVSASALDLVQGGHAADQSRFLMGLTCLSALPAALSGWAEWSHADDRTKRVGVAHAALNIAGVVTSFASYLVRRRGWSPAGAVLTGVAGTAFGLGGLLGGHLSLVRKFASHDPASDDEGALHGQYAG
ncbi:MAG TPA: DUF2231 domain-containing protein [Propionicimonas sp.]|jgi:uncharacterized membrane protein|uniref:DUF2231 domain-containing protein n=1 Tax=Propionicimonas sp. TaxID=1955623 RepID=UPI002F407D1F